MNRFSKLIRDKGYSPNEIIETVLMYFIVIGLITAILFVVCLVS